MVEYEDIGKYVADKYRSYFFHNIYFNDDNDFGPYKNHAKENKIASYTLVNNINNVSRLSTKFALNFLKKYSKIYSLYVLI